MILGHHRPGLGFSGLALLGHALLAAGCGGGEEGRPATALGHTATAAAHEDQDTMTHPGRLRRSAPLA